MTKPLSLKGNIKHAAIAENRHNPTMPNVSAEIWARGLTTTRVADLFRTLPGLHGHWLQLQGAINAGNNYFFNIVNYGGGFNDGGSTSAQGKILITWISDAVIAAAEAARFDFQEYSLRFTADTAWLKISRTRGKVKISSRPR